MKKQGLALCILLVTACSQRYPSIVPPEQPQDKYLSCQDIYAQMEHNNQVILELSKQQQRKPLKNFIPGISGLFFALPWFVMDFSDDEEVEKLSYSVRNERLYELANCKGARSLHTMLRSSG